LSLYILTDVASQEKQRLYPPQDVIDAGVDLLHLYTMGCKKDLLSQEDLQSKEDRIFEAFTAASKGKIHCFSPSIIKDIHSLAEKSSNAGLYYLKLSIIYITKLSGAVDPEKSFFWLAKFVACIDQRFASQSSLYDSVCFVRDKFNSIGGKYAKLAPNLINIYLNNPCTNYKVRS
jgi:hypothetical protein